jgi:hypothetical protein
MYSQTAALHQHLHSLEAGNIYLPTETAATLLVKHQLVVGSCHMPVHWPAQPRLGSQGVAETERLPLHNPLAAIPAYRLNIQAVTQQTNQA